MAFRNPSQEASDKPFPGWHGVRGEGSRKKTVILISFSKLGLFSFAPNNQQRCVGRERVWNWGSIGSVGLRAVLCPQLGCAWPGLVVGWEAEAQVCSGWVTLGTTNS